MTYPYYTSLLIVILVIGAVLTNRIEKLRERIELLEKTSHTPSVRDEG